MGRPVATVKLVSLHTLVTERQKHALEVLARKDIVSVSIVLRRLLDTAFSREGE
jgi:hypothetical protein